MTKTLNHIIFFSSNKIRIFFSATLGIRIFFQKKTITLPFKLNGPSLMVHLVLLSYISWISPVFLLISTDLDSTVLLETQEAVVVVIVWQLDLQLPVQSVPITIQVASLNPIHGKVYSIQHYVIKFVSDLQQVSVFLRFQPPIKLTSMI